MHRSETATYGGNDYAYRTCRRCGYDIFMCVCWYDFMDKIEAQLAIELRKGLYKSVMKKFSCINVVSLIRRMPTSISGMKGIKLLERIDKR